jgi:hypothetical protein
MIRLRNALAMVAAAGDGTSPVNRWGIVQSVDTVSMTAKVLIQPENVLSGFLPILSPSTGKITPPMPGWMAKLIPDAGDPDSYVIAGYSWNTGSMPAGTAAPGEVWSVVFGSTIKQTADGHVTISDASGATVSLPNTGHILMTDPSGATLELTNNGSIAVTGFLTLGLGMLKINNVVVIAP